VPTAAHPYDPARVLRRFVPRRGRRAGAPAAPAPQGATGAASAAVEGIAPAAVEGGAARGAGGARASVKRLARRALYTEPALRLLGHMLLVVARRA
jgi:hypothetical protein